ncbi:MAG: 50S ribosomal protein L11 methyltransferase, partial [Acidobacteria bacterium]|nr:50S ribosomal protein L11 methyltransferase [Acidobacteriota bacterium]
MGNTPKIWHAIDITVPPDAVEAAEFALNSLDSLGSEIIYFPGGSRDSVTVTGYFECPPTRKELQNVIDHALSIYEWTEIENLELAGRIIEDADWLLEWKKHWRPTKVGRFIIAPPWETIDETEKIVIRIEPNMAFGTGTHETTQLCLKAIDEDYRPGMTFSDIGTGTGILAIAAARIATERTDDTEGKSEDSNTDFSRTSPSSVPSVSSVAKFVGIDTDPEAVKIAKQNATANGASEVIDFRVGELTPEFQPYDFVCANLTLDVILPILPLFLEKANDTLVLSGILIDQERIISEALERAKQVKY